MGEREKILNKALASINLQIGQIVDISACYETEPWGFSSPEYFLNQAVMVETALSPNQILNLIHLIETGNGREREKKSGYSSRTIDIDILFYDDEIINSESLSIPHPQLHNRKFVLAPLCEIAPSKIHPVLKKSIQNLLDECHDPSLVRIYSKATTEKTSITVWILPNTTTFR